MDKLQLLLCCFSRPIPFFKLLEEAQHFRELLLVFILHIRELAVALQLHIRKLAVVFFLLRQHRGLKCFDLSDYSCKGILVFFLRSGYSSHLFSFVAFRFFFCLVTLSVELVQAELQRSFLADGYR